MSALPGDPDVQRLLTLRNRLVAHGEAEMSPSPHREDVRNAAYAALEKAFGPDNVETFEEDEFHIGVCFEDGDFIDLHVSGNRFGVPVIPEETP